MRATKAQLAVDIDFEKAKYPLLGMPKIDGCFSGDTLVLTNIGNIPIKDIVNNKLKLKVISYNENTKQLEEKKIINWFNNGTKQGLNFRSTYITKNHKMFNGVAWDKAEDRSDNAVIDDDTLSGFIIGMLLGDTSLVVERRDQGFGGARLKWRNSLNDKSYGDIKAKLLSKVTSVTMKQEISGYGKDVVTYTTKKINHLGACLWNLHLTATDASIGKRKENLTSKDLLKFNDVSLSIWYLDDGHLQYNNGNLDTPRIFLDVSRYSERTCEMFVSFFKNKYRCNPTFSIYKNGVGKRLSFTTVDSVFLLWRMAKVCSGLLPRKFPENLRFNAIPDAFNMPELKIIKSVVGKECEARFTAYDIEVEDNHSYFANGVLVHNCRAINLDGTLKARSLKPHENLFTTEKYSKDIYLGFDGELIVGAPNEEDTLNRTSSATRTINWKGDISWYVFDWLHPEVVHLPYIDRLHKLKDYVRNQGWALDGIHVVTYEIVNNAEEAEAFYQKCLDEGYEGAVFRNPNGKHKSGRSTLKENDFLRAKPQSTKEAVVLSVYEAMENQNEVKINELGRTERSSHKENLVLKGMLGGMIAKCLVTGLEINVGPGKMTHDQRKYYWLHQDEIVGKIITYKSMDKGVKDLPRFPRFIDIRSERDM